MLQCKTKLKTFLHLYRCIVSLADYVSPKHLVTHITAKVLYTSIYTM